MQLAISQCQFPGTESRK